MQETWDIGEYIMRGRIIGVWGRIGRVEEEKEHRAVGNVRDYRESRGEGV